MEIEPVTREERFLAAAGGQSVTPPTPITRKEQLLQGIIDAVKSGSATPDVIVGAVNDYLNANPVQPGATTEQAAQIEQNKNDIADLQTEVDELKESGGNGSGQNVDLTGYAKETWVQDGFQPKGDYMTAVTAAMITAALGYIPIDPGIATLALHTDGLLYLFVGGKPVGSGVKLPTGGIDGYITEDKQIIFNNLPDGEYSLAYLKEDGTISAPIGSMVKDTNVYYTITNTLTNCTNSNSTTQAVQGGSYSATITANSGYELSSVTVTMGGTDISASAVSGGKITIANVTGDIVITATATEIQTEPAEPTNFAEPNTTNTTDWTIWCNDARFGSDGDYRKLAGNIVTNYVPMEVGDIIRFEGLNVATTGTSMNQGMHFSDTNKAMLSCSYLSFFTDEHYNYLTVKVDNSVYEIDTAGLVKHEKAGASKYFRISGALTGTVNDVVINVKRNGQWL